MEIDKSAKIGTFGNLENLSFNEEDQQENPPPTKNHNINTAFAIKNFSPGKDDQTTKIKIENK